MCRRFTISQILPQRAQSTAEDNKIEMIFEIFLCDAPRPLR